MPKRPLLLAGLTLVTAHLLDLALSGPATSWLGVAAILAAARRVGARPAARHAPRPGSPSASRSALVALGFGVVSHGLHVVNSGPDWRDLSGVGYAAGGVLLIAAAVAAAAAPRRAPRRRGVRMARRARRRLAAGAVVFAYARPPPVHRGQPDHPRPAMGNSRRRARHRPRGRRCPRARPPQAGGVVRPVAQRRRRPPQPRLRREPRPRGRARPHARPPRLRRPRPR